MVRPTDHSRYTIITGVAESSQKSSPELSPEAVVRSWFASFATGNPDEIAAHVAPDFINEHTAALGSSSQGKAAYRERLPGFLSDMSGLRYEIEQLLVDGADVAAFYVMQASWQGTASFVIRGGQRLRVINGLITYRIDYWDSAAFLVQISDEARQAFAPFKVTDPEPS